MLLRLCMWGYLLYPEASVSVAGKLAFSKKAKWKVKDKKGGDGIKVYLYLHNTLWGLRVYMQCVCEQERASLSGESKALCAGLHGADSWPIKRGPPNAEQKKNTHIRRKPQPRGFLKCSAALCSLKRPTSASNMPQILSQQWTLTKGGAESKRDLKGRDGWMDGWMEQTCVLHFPISSLSCSSSMLAVSNALVLFVLWLEGQSPIANAKDHVGETRVFQSSYELKTWNLSFSSNSGCEN